MRALVIEHDHATTSGFVGDRLAERGYALTTLTVVPESDYHRPGVHFDFPGPDGWDLVVSLGAPWSVNDRDLIGSWVGDEIELLRRAHEAGTPVLGVCFGAQLLTVALGGTVERAPRPEIGWTEVTTDDPALIAPGPWFQWHFDRCLPPAATTVMARTELCVQGFTAGRSLGVQFHPEVDARIVGQWLAMGDDTVAREFGIDPEAMLEGVRRSEPDARARSNALVDAFLARAAVPAA